MSDDFDAAVASTLQPNPAQAARTGFSVAADTNPDAHAEALRVARRTGVPADTVMALPHEMKRQAAVCSINFDTLAKTSPATAALLADVEKAKVVHDDIENMGQIERKLRQFGGGAIEAAGMARNVGVIGVALLHEQGSSPMSWTFSDTRTRLKADPFPGKFATPP